MRARALFRNIVFNAEELNGDDGEARVTGWRLGGEEKRKNKKKKKEMADGRWRPDGKRMAGGRSANMTRRC